MTEGEALKIMLDHIECDALGLLDIHKRATATNMDRHEIVTALQAHAAEIERTLYAEFMKGNQ